MLNKLLALIAFLVLLGFLAILAFNVPSPDLIVVVLLTIGLVAYDFVSASFRNPK